LATAPRPARARAKAVKAESPSKAPRTNYRPDIDGIRGTAAIMVMGYHAHVPGFEGAYIGLDLFFVVSGFVIAGLLMGEFERSGRIRWSAFYARRARRLIPAKATMLLGVLILSYFVMAPTGAQQDTARSAAAAATFVSNFFFWQVAEVDYFASDPSNSVLLHTWSLSVEEQFYLALPLLVLLAYGLARLLRIHIGRTLLFVTLGLGIASLWGAMTLAEPSPEAAYYLPLTRAFEFLIGVLLAMVVAKVTVPTLARALMGLVGGALCAWVLIDPMPTEGYPSYWALIPCAGAALMIWAGTGSKTAITRFLAFPLFVWLGLVSYGWYLWHWPLLVMGESLNLSTPPLWARVMLVMVALGIAILSYHFIEGIFYKRSGHRNARKLYGGPRVVLTGVTTMSIVATLAGGAYLVAKDELESPKWQAVAKQLDDVPEMPAECLQDDEIIPSEPVACDLVPFEEDRPTILLWGDSHAWMFIPALEKAVKGRDVNLVAVVMGACPPFYAPASADEACKGSNRMALNELQELRRLHQPLRVVLGATWEFYLEGGVDLLDRVNSQANRAHISRMARYFQATAPKLFDRLAELEIPTDVIGQTASVLRNAPLCEAVPRLVACDVPRENALQNEQDTREWLETEMADLPEGARLIDATEQLCSEKTCYAERNGVVNFFDDNHLSATLSRRLSRYFEGTVDAVTEGVS
jgi:peptidoglycan/LPS O-acetylase OafA/YrhL